MKYLKIFLLLTLFIQISSISFLGEGEPYTIKENGVDRKAFIENEEQAFNLLTEKNGTFYITFLSTNEGVDISIKNIETFGKPESEKTKQNMYTLEILLDNVLNENRRLVVSTNKNCTIEIISVLKSEVNDYEIVEYSIDKELKVKNNNFVIFLGDEDPEKFDMKYNFKDDIKGKKVTYGFICLPTKEEKYLALGKNYRIYYSDLSENDVTETGNQFTAENKYYKKDKEKLKPNLAFIFSIDSNTKIEEFSFTINSEIINVFLIVSIVIALVFAVITFFLIRRKQTSEMTNVEGGDFYKKEEKEEKEEKDNKEENTEN